MSDSEYEYETDSTEDSEGSEVTYTSFEAALASLTERLAELDAGLDSMQATTQVFEKPVANIAIAAFTNPRVLEVGSFRATKFRVYSVAKEFLHLPHHIATFSEICAAIRQALRTRKEEVEKMWGARDFLGVLQNITDIIE